MELSRREIEVKLPYASVAAARDALSGLGATVTRARHFEENALFDRDAALKNSRRMLRVRQVDDEAWLTFKGPAPGGDRQYKVRTEEESAVADAGSLRRILEGVGFRPAYRYQKYRTEYLLDALLICLDETPIGCFVELEGLPVDIDRTAALLGFGPESYITASYRRLHDMAVAEGRFAGADMVFDGASEPDR